MLGAAQRRLHEGFGRRRYPLGSTKRMTLLLLVWALLASACAGETTSADGDEESAEEEGAATGSDDQPVALRLGGAAPGSSAQQMAVGLAELIEQSDSVSEASVLGTEGGVENVRLVESGELDFGVGGITAWYASLQGIQEFEGEEPYENWRFVVPSNSVPMYFITRDDTGIESVRDLEGRTAAMGPAGGGPSSIWSQMFEALGIEGDFQNMPFEEGNARLADGRIDAHLLVVRGLPASIEAESMLGDDIHWVGVDDPDDIEQIMNGVPAFAPMTMDGGGVYESLDSLDTVGTMTGFFANKDVPDHAVSEVVRLVDDKGEQELVDYGAWSDVWRDGWLEGSFPLIEAIGGYYHCGAVIGYEDAGYDVPEAVIPPECI